MKSYAKSKVIILLTLGILFAISPIITCNLRVISGNNNKSSDINEIYSLENKNLQTSAVSGKIHIDNNWTAAKIAGICTGNGIYSEPYVIKDFVIDGGGSGSCILIENSDVYFRIENCALYNSGGGSEDAGIKLKNTCNGTLIYNNCSNNENIGILLINNCDDNDITQNTANHNNELGIYLGESNHNDISGNKINDNTEFGIILVASDINVMTGNTINNNNEGGICLVVSDINVISGNTVNYNGVGIGLIYGSNNSISDNSIDKNNDTGIDIDKSNDNNISGNAVNYNNDGIRLRDSYNNSILGNRVLNNNNLGIHLDYRCHDNSITLNCFINNNINADCDGSNNHWDNGIKGNYWGNYNGSDADEDGIGDVPYNITGNAGSQDNFPLMKCPISTQGGGIPGYNPFFVLSILSLVAILMSRKIKKSQI